MSTDRSILRKYFRQVRLSKIFTSTRIDALRIRHDTVDYICESNILSGQLCLFFVKYYLLWPRYVYRSTQLTYRQYLLNTQPWGRWMLWFLRGHEIIKTLTNASISLGSGWFRTLFWGAGLYCHQPKILRRNEDNYKSTGLSKPTRVVFSVYLSTISYKKVIPYEWKKPFLKPKRFAPICAEDCDHENRMINIQ